MRRVWSIDIQIDGMYYSRCRCLYNAWIQFDNIISIGIELKRHIYQIINSHNHNDAVGMENALMDLIYFLCVLRRIDIIGWRCVVLIDMQLHVRIQLIIERAIWHHISRLIDSGCAWRSLICFLWIIFPQKFPNERLSFSAGSFSLPNILTYELPLFSNILSLSCFHLIHFLIFTPTHVIWNVAWFIYLPLFFYYNIWDCLLLSNRWYQFWVR